MTRSDTRCPQPRSRFLDLREDPRTRKEGRVLAVSRDDIPKLKVPVGIGVQSGGQWEWGMGFGTLKGNIQYDFGRKNSRNMSSSLFPGGLFNLFEIGTSRQPWWKG
ncbi:unnamed protein product [Timema podura]|uniref:Uncharacterized protein n=1 Tax=Timema podura TaxID=61482 RepID=A0ABN7NW29_TIMPD|nr:unnamed protein product [Timema podura]